MYSSIGSLYPPKIDQFDTLFEFVDQEVELIVERSIDLQDSEILDDFAHLLDVHTVLEEVQ